MKKFNIELFGRKSGFTLTELLIVVVIIAILATLALPMLVKTLEKAKVGEAISNLNLIRTGQKIYYLEHGFFAGADGGDTEAGIEKLNIENPDNQTSRYFYYEITTPKGATANFTAEAERGGTGAIGAPDPYDGDKYIIQKEGLIRGRFTTGEEL